MSDAASALANATLVKHWGLREQALQIPRGVSRITWRIGTHYWLSQIPDSLAKQSSWQAAFLQRLRYFIERDGCSFEVPDVVPAADGRLVVSDSGFHWCLTRNLEGSHPDCGDPGLYSASARGLARFHDVLRRGFPSLPPDAPVGIIVETRQKLLQMENGPFVPFTQDAQEASIVSLAAEELRKRIDALERLRKQLIHGDWTPENVLFTTRGRGPHLAAVLDFERLGSDPIHVDVGSICSTLLMWSGLNRIHRRMRTILTTYEKHAGNALETADVYAAMLAYWFCHYWRWRARIEGGWLANGVEERLCLRIASVLEFGDRLALRS